MGLQKSFLLVKFFNQISCNKGLKAKISCFFSCFFCLIPLGLESSSSRKTALLCSWHHIGWRNTKICIHGASQMEWKHGKCWKLQLFEGKLWVFISYLTEMKTVSMFAHQLKTGKWLCHFQVPSGKFMKNQPKSEDFMGLYLVFYTLNLHEIKRKCKFKLTFIFINKNIVNRW